MVIEDLEYGEHSSVKVFIRCCIIGIHKKFRGIVMSGMTLDRLASIITDGAYSDEEIGDAVEFIDVLKERLEDAKSVLSFSKQYEDSQQWSIEQQAIKIKQLEAELKLYKQDDWREY